MMLPTEMNSTDEVLHRREAPCLVVLDEQYRIVGAEPRLQDVFAALGCVQIRADRLPAEIEAAVRNTARRGRDGGLDFPVPGVMLRTNFLSGVSGKSIAVAVERLRLRSPLQSAVRRFRLTPREVEVLELLLSGYGGRQISARLNIAENTVAEHFKHLLLKIDARNRASMIAKVLHWANERA